MVVMKYIFERIGVIHAYALLCASLFSMYLPTKASANFNCNFASSIDNSDVFVDACEYSTWVGWSCFACGPNIPGDAKMAKRVRQLCCEQNVSYTDCFTYCNKSMNDADELESCCKACPNNKTYASCSTSLPANYQGNNWTTKSGSAFSQTVNVKAVSLSIPISKATEYSDNILFTSEKYITLHTTSNWCSIKFSIFGDDTSDIVNTCSILIAVCLLMCLLVIFVLCIAWKRGSKARKIWPPDEVHPPGNSPVGSGSRTDESEKDPTASEW